MALPLSSAVSLLTKRLNSDSDQPSLPWTGIESLARFWAGSGTLLDWVAPVAWDIEIAWDIDVVRARVAEVALLSFQRHYLNYLPKHAGEWLDIIAQQTNRIVDRVELPDAHTDWPATFSEFGGYPAQLYVQRRTSSTYDSPFTRVLKWTAQNLERAESVVGLHFGRRPFDSGTRRRVLSPLELPEVASANIDLRQIEHDLEVCKAAGGAWLIVSRLARQLSAIWGQDPLTQLKNLAPILPELGHQLFELGTLGNVIAAAHNRRPGTWTTENPVGAAKSGEPCFSLRADGTRLDVRFQTVPRANVSSDSVYRTLGNRLGAGALRPDIWLNVVSLDWELDIVIECKFSNEPTYVSTGITQSMAYSVEFPRLGTDCIYVTVGPQETIDRPGAWEHTFAIASPNHLADLVGAAIAGEHRAMLEQWGK